MSEFPETQDSLLLQVKDPANREAWERFAGLYRPVIQRIARIRGLQDADAEDLAQQVLVAVAGAIGRWQRSGQHIRFRHWLSKVTRNAILNALTRQPADRSAGGTSVRRLLDDVAVSDAATDALIRQEYRRELYRRAAATVQTDVTAETWQMFERTVLQGMSVDAVAAELGRSPGAVYTARSRVMFRLRCLVQELDAEQEGN